MEKDNQNNQGNEGHNEEHGTTKKSHAAKVEHKAPPHKNIMQQKHEEEKAELNAQLAQMQDKILRLQAEQENLRKRLTKDIEQSIHYANVNFAKDLLEVMENFHRAMDSFPVEEIQSNDVMRNMYQGITMIKKSLDDAFVKHHIERIFPINEIFDHDMHQAIAQQPSADNAPGTIIQVIQAGYKLKDRLLRPALVIIAKEMEN